MHYAYLFQWAYPMYLLNTMEDGILLKIITVLLPVVLAL